MLYYRTYIMHKPVVEYKSCSHKELGDQEVPFDDRGELYRIAKSLLILCGRCRGYCPGR